MREREREKEAREKERMLEQDPVRGPNKNNLGFNDKFDHKHNPTKYERVDCISQ